MSDCALSVYKQQSLDRSQVSWEVCRLRAHYQASSTSWRAISCRSQVS